MFTGLIEGRGEIRRLSKRGEELELELRLEFPARDITVGESISVNGVCLTVERAKPDGFIAYASAETVAHSSLGELKHGDKVNIERALRLGDRLGGHLVSGHVDAVSEVAKVTERGTSLEVWLTFPQAFTAQLAPKGSVTLDGISLTINACLSDRFSVNIIPETARATTAALWRPGSRVNLETDLLAKYVARYLDFTKETGAGNTAEKTRESGLTLDFLRQQGF